MKKHIAIIFWALYMLFFAIPFPMFLYYAINSEFDVTTLKDKNPYLALGYLALSVILWLIVLIGYFRKWIVQIFIKKKNLENIKRNGLQREAKIINAVKVSKPNSKLNTYDLELVFKNLADTEIKHKTTITDAKPHERRFETGKKLNLLLNRDKNKEPNFIIASATATLNIRIVVLRILGWTTFTIAVIAYYIFSYQYESYGMGWRFMCIGHPLIICPFALLFYRYIVQFIFNKLSGLDGNALMIKFGGVRTHAKLIQVSQTGTYINEQPEMRFELEYTDNKHHVHRSSQKKVIGLLELDMTKQEYLEIFYLPENPKQIAFANDLNNIHYQMKKLIILMICCTLLSGCEQISKSITETITPTDTIFSKEAANPVVVTPEIKPPNVDSLIKTVIQNHTTMHTEIHIESKGTGFLTGTDQLESAEKELRNLPQYTGKEIFIYSTLYFYNDGTINVMLQHPENPKYVDAYEFSDNKWSDPRPIQLSVRDDIKSRLVSLNKISFVNAAKVTEIYNKKAQQVEGAKPITSAYVTIWNNKILWHPTTINGSRERYTIDYNDDGSLKAFKQD